jgi:hypothetical protein
MGQFVIFLAREGSSFGTYSTYVAVLNMLNSDD